jgi:hypothetical protein
MAVVNRRNAMLGWAVWQVGKQVAKRKAKKSVSAEAGRKRRLSKAALFAGIMAVGGVLVFWRKKGSDDELPPV